MAQLPWQLNELLVKTTLPQNISKQKQVPFHCWWRSRKSNYAAGETTRRERSPQRCKWPSTIPVPIQNHSKTAALMLEMTKPIHNTGKVVTIDSGFCVTVGVLALCDAGVFGQALIKKRGLFWPMHVPSNQINEFINDNPLGDSTILKKCIDGKNFFVHCQKDDCYVTEDMSSHGLIQPVDDFVTYLNINREQKSSKYIEPLSHHNQLKHWVDDMNNHHHDPIALKYVWGTKW